MNCKQADNLLIYVETNDPGLSALDRAAFFEHLAGCSACREAYEQGQYVRDMLQQHARLSPDTVELLAAHGEVISNHLLPIPDEALEITDAQVEAGLAKLMAMIDQQEQAQSPHRPMSLEEGVADLRRRVNTVEAYQHLCQPSGCPGTPGSSVRVASHGGWQRKLYYAAGIAACLAVAAVLGLVNLSSPQQPSPLAVQTDDATSLVQWVTVDGMQPIPVGEPIHSGDQLRELLLGGLHRVVMNTSSTATVDAQDGVFSIDLAQGELYVEVVPGVSQGFTVLTPNAQLIITGTKFNVRAASAMEGNQTELTLLKGSVRLASLEGSAPVDVLAGHMSRVTGRSTPTQPQPINALAATAWARQVAVGHAIARLEPSNGGADLDSLLQDAIVSDLPDYRSWGYERFRDEMRSWFAEQFPWAMELEKTLQYDHGIDADYLDVLVVSGDIWQFRNPGPKQISEPATAFHPATAERLAHWYGLEDRLRLDALGYRTNTSALTSHSGEAFAAAIERWRANTAQASPQQLDGLALFSLKASDYLTRTRVAAYLWMQEHPEQTQRLLTSGDYAGTFLAPLLPTSPYEQFSQMALLSTLDSQVDACAGSYQQAQQLLMLPHPEHCPTDEWTVLKRRFNEILAPLGTSQKGHPQ